MIKYYTRFQNLYLIFAPHKERLNSCKMGKLLARVEKITTLNLHNWIKNGKKY